MRSRGDRRMMVGTRTMPNRVVRIAVDATEYPATLRESGVSIPFDAIGNSNHLTGHLLGFFCSAKCPGNLILDTYDLARELRNAPVTVIGGFHSPMEKECLDLLLRGTQPVIICAARSIDRMRIPKPWKAPLADGRLLVISPFVDHRPRITLELAEQRNRFVAHLANEVFIAHAAAGSKTLAFCEELLNRQKPVMTIDRAENAALLRLGVTPLAVSDATRWARARR